MYIGFAIHTSEHIDLLYHQLNQINFTFIVEIGMFS